MEKITITIPIEVIETLRSVVRSEVQALKSENGISLSGDEPLLRRSDISQMFGVSLPTVHSWMNAGILPFHRIGGRTYFKKDEVMTALKSIKIKRRFQ